MKIHVPTAAAKEELERNRCSAVPARSMHATPPATGMYADACVRSYVKVSYGIREPTILYT
eukprot:13978556-Ditylum_brightwellii.AAC.1